MVQRVDSEFGQIYGDPDAPRRYRSFFIRWVALVLVIAALGPLIVAAVLVRQSDRAESHAVTESQSDVLAFSAVVALSPASTWSDVLGARGLEGLLLDTEGELRIIVNPLITIDPVADERWRSDEVPSAARRSGDRTFTSTAPDGMEWEHFRVAAPGGETLLLGRPGPNRAGAFDATIIALAATAVAALVLITLAAWSLYRRTVRPSLFLLDAVEDLRVRGEIRTDVRNRLTDLRSAPIELTRLGATLVEIEREGDAARHQTQALLQAASTLSRSLDVDAVLTSALVQLQDLLGIDRAALLQYDLHEDRFHVVVTRGHDDAWIEDLAATPGGGTPTALRALREGVPHQTPDTEAEVVPSGLRQRARRHDYRSLLAVPLTGEHERPTVLVLHSRTPRSYSWDEIELSKSFASIAGAALRNAELFARTDERLREESSRLGSIVESVESGLLVAGSDDRVLYVNATLRRLLPPGFAVAGAENAESMLAALLDQGGVGAAERDALRELTDDADSWVDIDLANPAAGTAHWRVRSFTVRSAAGDRIGRGQIWTDVSEERELQQMKSGLLAAVSHEFRTPLALIKGYATTLLADDVTWKPDDQAEFLRLVSREADRLTELVQRILDMRRIDAGMVALQVMPIELDAVIEAALDAIGGRRDRVVVEPHASLLIEVDAARITTVLRNLLDNACTYSPDDEVVDLRVEVDEDQLRVVVRDRGPGVDPALRHRLFDTFVRGDQGLASEHRGLGLGLALSKGFIEAHDGRIWIEDPTDGPGTVFVFTLPCRPTVARMSSL